MSSCILFPSCKLFQPINDMISHKSQRLPRYTYKLGFSVNWRRDLPRRRLLYQSINQWLPPCKSPPPKLHYNYPEKEAHWGGKLVDRRVIDPCLLDGRAAIHPLCSIYSTSPINVRSLQLWRFSGQRRWMCQRSWLFNMASAYQPRTRSLFGELN